MLSPEEGLFVALLGGTKAPLTGLPITPSTRDDTQVGHIVGVLVYLCSQDCTEWNGIGWNGMMQSSHPKCACTFASTACMRCLVVTCHYPALACSAAYAVIPGYITYELFITR